MIDLKSARPIFQWLSVITFIGIFNAHASGAEPWPDPRAFKEPQDKATIGLKGSIPAHTLSNGSGDGSVSVTVDGYGSFGSSTLAGPAIFDPIGALEPSSTVYESGLFFGPLGDFLTTDTFGAALPGVEFLVTSANLAQSRFDIDGFEIALTQRLSPIGPGGSSLEQTYQITNRSGTAAYFPVVRHVDGDLFFDGTLIDSGGVSPGGGTLFEFDSGDNPSAPTTFVGIRQEGGEAEGFTVQPFRYTDDIVAAGGIPLVDRGVLAGDLDQDGILDEGYDVTLSQQAFLSIEPGATVAYKTITIFGAEVQGSLSFELLDPACDAARCDGRFLQRSERGVLPADDAAILAQESMVTRQGVVADGVSLLLLRSPSDVTVTFTLSDSLGSVPVDASPCPLGTLKSRDGVLSSCSALTAQPEPTPAGPMVFALFQAPLNAPELPDSDNTVVISIEADNAAPTERRIQIQSPPVLLVHGVWSSRQAWRNSLFDEPGQTFEGVLREAGFQVRLFDHSDLDQAAGSFDPTNAVVTQRLGTEVASVLSDIRERGLAAARVDVVGHSMGGLIARSRMASLQPAFRTLANYDAGEFRKVITIGTPHHGTALADALVANRCARREVCTRFGCAGRSLEQAMAAFGRPIGPAVFGFQTASPELATLPVAGLFHSVVTTAPSDSDSESNLNSLLSLARLSESVDDLLGGDAQHDTIVPTASQSGGARAASTTELAGILHASAELVRSNPAQTNSLSTAQAVSNLLAAPLHAGAFGDLETLPGGGSYVGPAACPETRSQSAKGSDAMITIAPAPGTSMTPGSTLVLEFDVSDVSGVSGALLRVGDALLELEGAPPYSQTYQLPPSQSGRLEIYAETKGEGSRQYAAQTHVLVQATATPLSISSVPDTVSLSPGETVSMDINAQFAGGSTIDISTSDAGTSFSTLSGTTHIVEVSPHGVLRGMGTGQDTVIVELNGVSTAVLVSVSETEKIFANSFEDVESGLLR